MHSQILNAAMILTAAGFIASCTHMDRSSASQTPLVLSKKRAAEIFGAKNKGTSQQTVSSTSGSYNSFYPASPSVAVKDAGARYSKDKHGLPTYGSERDRLRYVRTTAYSHMENEPGAPGRLNATGTILKYGHVRSAAADWSRYPVGTTFKIKGLPHTYVVDDYGSALVGTNTIDIFHPTLSSMRKWGTRNVEINVVKWGDWDRTLKLLGGRTKYSHCRRMYYAAKAKVGGSRSVASTATKGDKTF